MCKIPELSSVSWLLHFYKSEQGARAERCPKPELQTQFSRETGTKETPWDHVICVLRTEQTLRVCKGAEPSLTLRVQKYLSPALPGNVEKVGPEKGCVSSDLKSEDSPGRYRGLRTRALRAEATSVQKQWLRLWPGPLQHSLPGLLRQIRQHLLCSLSLCETGRPSYLINSVMCVPASPQLGWILWSWSTTV